MKQAVEDSILTIDTLDVASTKLVNSGDEALGSGHKNVRQQRKTASSHEFLRGSKLAGRQTRALQETSNPYRCLNVQYPCKHFVDLDLILRPVAVDEQHTHNPHAPSIERDLESLKKKRGGDGAMVDKYAVVTKVTLWRLQITMLVHFAYIFKRVLGKVLSNGKRRGNTNMLH